MGTSASMFSRELMHSALDEVFIRVHQSISLHEASVCCIITESSRTFCEHVQRTTFIPKICPYTTVGVNAVGGNEKLPPSHPHLCKAAVSYLFWAPAPLVP
jgi:hypothetical protein